MDYGTMRLICPNCGAQYEVAEDAIPPSGRDVQCSNCGHAWFQHPALIEIDDAEVVDAPVAVMAGTDMSAAIAPEAPVPAGDFGPAPADEMTPPPMAAAVPDAPEPAATEEPQAPAPVETPPMAPVVDAAPVEPPIPDEIPAELPVPAASQRSLDDNLLAVLREEAEREVAQRRAEASRAIETQPELGLVAAAPPAPKPPVATPRKTPAQDFSYLSSDADTVDDDLASAVPEASVRPAARRDLLPDVEMISSTLQSSRNRDDDDNPMPNLPPIRRASGFRSGFLLSVLLAVIVVVSYVLAPRLAEQFPAAKGALDAYVAGIDALRLWIGMLVASLTGMLEG